MKYIIYLLAATYIIGGIYIINVFFINKKINIENLQKSIVIIIPKQKLANYKNNPNGLFKEYDNPGRGLGFFINSKGEIQTVNHILSENNIVFYKGKKYESKIILNNKKEDLAIIKINTKNNTYLKKGKLENTEKIYSFGLNMENENIIYNLGKILNKKSKLDNKSNLLEISNQLKPGFSGGPIINQNGNVIGINFAISNGKNYGIKY